ncbi:DUF3772 domain-containing protein [Jannaschia sp. S6380]|uniref:DUF3772 domain-containing protein n=1 Tax=Jannaschia sp. S6380 TaxID=2926408 RepID=UPI001FF4B032|nr:DUF3772 domain-containing protein [Jannaschia sp. S6380]MCK0166799.1 DUF3772 domain-containing protein [Jannaschia sp. S6380]
MIRLAVLLLTLWAAMPALAQVVDPEWPVVVTRTEEVLADGAASVDALEALREELVGWRARFEEGLSTNDTRIETLEAQLDALGPPPAEGETETPATAAQRAEIEARLDDLRQPSREAQTAFSTADGLIAETDRLIEAARADELLAKAPAPLNPLHWLPTLGAIGAWLAAFGRELWAPFASPTARAVWQARGVELGVLILVATLLLWRSGVWLSSLRDRIAGREGESAVIRLTLLAISLGRLGLPVLGLVAIVRILQLMGAEGLRVEAATVLLPIMGFVILAARWLALQALPQRDTAPAFLPVAAERRAAGRRHALTLGVLLACAFAVEVIAPSSDDPVVSRAVSHFVILIAAGFSMVRMGRIFLIEGQAARGEEDDGFWAQILRLLGRALFFVGLAAPLAAAFGYVTLGNAVLWSSVLTLALIMLIGVLQGVVFDIYAAVTRRADAGRDALTPTLVGFALAIAALPVVALIWGIRASRLGEWWATFLRGFTIGETRISPEVFLIFAVIFLLGWLAVRLIKGVLRTSVLPKTKLDSGGTNAILSGTSYVGITLAALIAITAAGIDLSGLAIIAGALSVGLGFGLQNIVQNFVSGIILLIERPIKIGDWVLVQASGTEGFVREISVRSTRIETFDRQDVIVPNADLISGVVTNYTLANSSGRVVLTVGVAYGTDTRRVEAILQEVAEAHPMVILNPPPLVTFDGFGADSLNFTVRVVLRDILFKVIVASELNHAIAERFAAEGLEIPFAQRDIWLRNPEALRPEKADDP